MSRQARKAAAAAQDLLRVDAAEARKTAAAQSQKDEAAPMLKAQEEWSRVQDMLLALPKHFSDASIFKPARRKYIWRNTGLCCRIYSLQKKWCCTFSSNQMMCNSASQASPLTFLWMLWLLERNTADAGIPHSGDRCGQRGDGP
ncbi:unnamed protein product [Urochloa humidicola]